MNEILRALDTRRESTLHEVLISGAQRNAKFAVACANYRTAWQLPLDLNQPAEIREYWKREVAARRQALLEALLE